MQGFVGVLEGSPVSPHFNSESIDSSFGEVASVSTSLLSTYVQKINNIDGRCRKQ